MVGRAAFDGHGHRKTQDGQIELIHELAQEAGGMIGRHPVFQGRRKKKLLSVIGCDGLGHVSLTFIAATHSK
jgi:hypothetical protein